VRGVMFSVCALESRGGRHRCANWLAVAFTDDQDDAARADRKTGRFLFWVSSTTPYTMPIQKNACYNRLYVMKRWMRNYDKIVLYLKTHGKPPNRYDTTDKVAAKLGMWLCSNTNKFGKTTHPEYSTAIVNDPKHKELFLQLKFDIEQSLKTTIRFKPLRGPAAFSVDSLRKRVGAATDSDSPVSQAVSCRMDQSTPDGDDPFLSVEPPFILARADSDSRIHAPIAESYVEDRHTVSHRNFKIRNNATFVKKLTEHFGNIGFDHLVLVLDGPRGLTTKAILSKHPGAKILIVNKCRATCTTLKTMFSQPPFIGVDVIIKECDLLDFLTKNQRTGESVAAAYVDACTNKPDYVASCVRLLPTAEILAVTILTGRSKYKPSGLLMQQLHRTMQAFKRLWPDDALDVGVFEQVFTSFWKREPL